MTPPIGDVYVHRQERASFAAELRLLFKNMRSHAFSDCFSIPFPPSGWWLERRHATTNGQHLSGALTDGGQQTQVAVKQQ